MRTAWLGWSLGLSTLAVAACGGAPPPPAASAPPTEAAAEPAPNVEVDVAASAQAASTQTTSAMVAVAAPAEDAPPPKLPTTCTPAGPKKLCTPDADFAKRACSAEYPDAALALFLKGTPWTRGYLTRDVDAWNATGGRTHSAKVLFDEEVIVLQHRQAEAKGGVVMVVNGETGSYDVLRWDGSCVSVMADELTTHRPPQPKRAAIPWRRLDEGTRTALLSGPKVKASFDAVGKACDGTNEAKCAQAQSALTGAIVEFVRGGGELPEPAHRP